MKYCLKYTNISTKLTKANEIAIKYIEDRGLLDFMKKFSSQRIILRVDAAAFPESEVTKLIAIRRQHPEYNFAVALKGSFIATLDVNLMETLQENNIPFFRESPCLNWEELNFLVAKGVSDINISGPLGFELSKVKRVLDISGRKVQVRATANLVVNESVYTDTLVGFYIRPEDVSVYEGYIDVLEFEGLEHQDTFYTIYAEKGAFIGNLNQCIYNIREQVDNKGLILLFGERRRDCGRQCLSGGRCNRCYTLADLSIPMGARAREKIMETIKKEQEKIQSSEE